MFNLYMQRLETHWKENPKLIAYLKDVEVNQSPGLISNAYGWIMDGWDLHDPAPCVEQLAASILMEASSEEQAIVDGNSDSDRNFPNTLRGIAYNILRLAGHLDPLIGNACDANLQCSNLHERKGNIEESVELRRVANLLGSLYQGRKGGAILRTPEQMEIDRAKEMEGLIDVIAVYTEEPHKGRYPCKYCPVTKMVRFNPPLYSAGYIELPDGTTVTEEDGLHWDN